MERAKTEYAWRAYSPERAIDELRRLKSFTDLSQFVVNIADPLFGFKRRWRREVLESILIHEVVPRQFSTLTRSDDLDDVDVSLLARFSMGIGLESGSPRMLQIMQMGNTPERYLGAIERLARFSKGHGLNWATNIIVGHPGETPETLIETRDFLKRLPLTAGDTFGWLSIDPFRLYPGAIVHEQMTAWPAAQAALTAAGPILASATEGHRVRLALFALGKASSLEVTEAETTLRRARLAAVVARVDVRIAELKVLHAVGFSPPGQGYRRSCVTSRMLVPLADRCALQRHASREGPEVRRHRAT